MKYPSPIFAIILMIGIGLISCSDDNNDCITGQGSIISETLSLASFTGINGIGSTNVFFSQGTTQEVIAEGHSNIISRIETNVSGGIWDIKLREGCYRNYQLTIHITVPNIDDVTITGSGNVVINDFDNQSDLNLTIIGSGNIELNEFQDADNMAIDIVGSGNIVGKEIISTLQTLDIDIDGSGNYEGFLIMTKDCDIRIAGSGDCEVYAEDMLDVTIAGSGDVYYKGTPLISTNISGTGKIVNSN